MCQVRLYFDTREDAEDYLLQYDFEFMGAPNRWRKARGTVTLRADAVSAGAGWRVRVYGWQDRHGSIKTTAWCPVAAW